MQALLKLGVVLDAVGVGKTQEKWSGRGKTQVVVCEVGGVVVFVEVGGAVMCRLPRHMVCEVGGVGGGDDV